MERSCRLPGSCGFQSGWPDEPFHFHPAETKKRNHQATFALKAIKGILTDCVPDRRAGVFSARLTLMNLLGSSSIIPLWGSALWGLLWGWDGSLRLGKEPRWGHVASRYPTVVFFNSSHPLFKTSTLRYLWFQKISVVDSRIRYKRQGGAASRD